MNIQIPAAPESGGSSRRDFMRLAGYGALGAITSGMWPFINSPTSAKELNTGSETKSVPDLDISLSAQSDQVAIFPGSPTQVWRYRATVHKGDVNRIS